MTGVTDRRRGEGRSARNTNSILDMSRCDRRATDEQDVERNERGRGFEGAAENGTG